LGFYETKTKKQKQMSVTAPNRQNILSSVLRKFLGAIFIYCRRLLSNPVVYIRARTGACLPARKRSVIISGFLLMALFSLSFSFLKPANTSATTDSTINFQARLENGTGAIVPDGSYNIEFKLYSASSGGSALWTEDYLDGSSQGVQTIDGYLSVNLGSITAFPTTINWNQPLWLTMNIGGTTTGTPSWDGEMNPRLQLTALPYAFQSGSAGQLATNNGTYTSQLTFTNPTANDSIVLPDASGTVCLDSSAACNFVSGSASNFIQNGVGLQTAAGFDIQTGSTGNTTATIRALASQTGSLLQFQNSSGTPYSGFNSTGQLYFQGGSYTGTVVQNSLAQNTTYYLPDPGASSATICLSAGTAVGNCAGGTGSITGSGTANYVARFSTSTTLAASSLLYDNGSFVGVNSTTNSGELSVASSSASESALYVQSTASSTSTVTALIQGSSGQSADLLDVKNYGGSTLLSVGSTGVVSVYTGYQINGAATTGTFLRGNGTNYVSSTIQTSDLPNLQGTYISNSPTSTTNNTIQPITSGVVALTVNGNTSGTAADALDINQTKAANGITITQSGNGVPLDIANNNVSDGEDIFLNSTSGTVTNGIQIKAQAAGNTTNLLNLLTNGSSGAVTNGIVIGNSSGNTITNGINFGTSVTNLISSANFSLQSSGNITSALGTTINGQTISSAASFTGTLGVSGLTSLGQLKSTGAASSSSATVAIQAGSSQTGDLLQFDNSSGIKISGFNSSGQLYYQSGSYAGTIQVAPGGLGQATTYYLPDPGTTTAQTICLSYGNCAGVGGSLAGYGTSNYIAKFSSGSTSTISSSTILSDNGSFIGLNDLSTNYAELSDISGSSTQSALYVQSAASPTVATAVIQGASGQAADLLDVDLANGSTITTVDDTNDLNVEQGNLNVYGISDPSSVTLTLNSAVGSGTLSNGTTYKYQVAADNASGVTAAIASTPTSQSPSNAHSSITVSWSAVTNATSYTVYRKTGAGNWQPNTIPTSVCSAGTCSITDDGSAYTWSGSVTPATFNGTGILNVANGITTGAYLNVTNQNGSLATIQMNGFNAFQASASTGANPNESTFVGVGANFTGGYNTDVGYGSGGGTYSVAIGANAMTSTSNTGTYNVGIGNASLNQITTGSYNIAIGYQAGGTTLTGDTTGSYNTYLGQGSGTNISTQVQNASAVGTDSEVNLSNTVSLGCTNGVNGCTTTSYVGIGSSGYAANLLSTGNSYYSNGSITQSGSSYTITGTSTTFTTSMNGGTIIYSDGTRATVTYVSATSLTSSIQKAESSASYVVVYGGFNVTASNTVFLQNTSTTALQIENTAGSSMFTVDTSGDAVTISGQASGWNTSTAASLYVGKNSTTSRSINAAGTINASGADYAEWIPWSGTKPDQGTIINYEGSDYVVSSPYTAAFVGNDGIDETNAIMVTFVGQVPVDVTGAVNARDILINNGDGTAKAVDPSKATVGDLLSKIGIAEESNSDTGVKLVETSVGTTPDSESDALQGQSSTYANLTVSGESNINSLAVVNNETVGGNINVSGSIISAGDITTGGIISASGTGVSSVGGDFSIGGEVMKFAADGTVESAEGKDLRFTSGNNVNISTSNFGGLNISSGTGGITASSSGDISLMASSTATLALDTTAGDIDVGTGLNSKNVNIGNNVGQTSINIQSGTGGINLHPDGSDNNGVNIQPSVDSNSVFQVQTANGNNLFSVDSAHDIVQIGSSNPNDNPVLLRLNNYDSATEPGEADGAIYYNSSTGNFRCGESGTWTNCIGGLISSNTSASASLDGSISGSQSFSDISSIPANYCVQGRVINVTASGLMTTTSTAQPVSFSLKLGNNQISGESVALTPSSDLTNRGWQMQFQIICDANPSSSSAVTGQGWIILPGSSANSADQTSDIPYVATNLPTNTAQNLSINASFGGSATAGNSVTLEQLIVSGQ
jgi:hypothetical protein